MMLLLLMPTSLFLGASLSYDAIIVPVALLFVAELLRLLDDGKERVDYKDIIIISVCTLFMVSIKMVYAPFLLLLFFVPYKKFGNLKRYFISIGSVVFSFIIGYVLPTLLNRIANRSLVSQMVPEVIEQREYFFIWRRT